MRTGIRLAALLALCGVWSSAAWEHEPLARVELASYQQLAADIASLSAQVQQPMMNMGLMAFGNLLGSPGMLGIDQTRPIQLAMFSEEGDWTQSEMVMVLPLLGEGQDYLDSLQVAYELLQEDGPARRFRATRNVQSFREMTVQIFNGHAIVSPSAPLVRQVADQLEKESSALAVRGISGTLRVSAQLPGLISTIRERLEEDARAADAMGPDEDDVAEEALAELQRVYAEAVVGVLEQAQALGIGLQCNDNGLTIYSRLDVLPETTLSRILGESVPPSERLLRLVPPDATLVYASGMMGSLVRHGMEPYLEFSEHILGAQQKMLAAMMNGGAPPEPQATLKPLMTQLTELYAGYGDAFVLCVGPSSADPQIPVFFEAVAVTEEQRFREMLDKNLDLINESYTQLQIPIRFERLEDREHEGVPVQSLGVRLTDPGEIPGAEAVNPEFAVFWEDLRDSITWLEKAVIEVGVSQGVLLTAMGKPGCLNPFLERLNHPGEEVWSARSQALFPEIRNHDQASEFWMLRPMETVKMVASLFGETEPGAALLQQLPDDGDGIGGLTMSSASAVMGATRISASSLGSFVRSAGLLQRAAMQGIQETARPGELPPQGDPVEVVLPED